MRIDNREDDLEGVRMNGMEFCLNTCLRGVFNLTSFHFIQFVAKQLVTLEVDWHRVLMKFYEDRTEFTVYRSFGGSFLNFIIYT